MSEFWERFAFYGIHWAMVLYIVAQFHGGDASGEKPASELYGAYLALIVCRCDLRRLCGRQVDRLPAFHFIGRHRDVGGLVLA